MTKSQKTNLNESWKNYTYRKSIKSPEQLLHTWYNEHPGQFLEQRLIVPDLRSHTYYTTCVYIHTSAGRSCIRGLYSQGNGSHHYVCVNKTATGVFRSRPLCSKPCVSQILSASGSPAHQQAPKQQRARRAKACSNVFRGVQTINLGEHHTSDLQIPCRCSSHNPRHRHLTLTYP